MNAIDYDAWDLRGQAIPGNAVSNGRNEPSFPIGWLPDIIILRVRVNEWRLPDQDLVREDLFTTYYSQEWSQLRANNNANTCTIPVSDWPRVKAGLDAINAEHARKAFMADKGVRQHLPACCRQCEHKDDNPETDPCKPCIAARSFEAKEQREAAKSAKLVGDCSGCTDGDGHWHSACNECIRLQGRQDRYTPAPCPTCGKA